MIPVIDLHCDLLLYLEKNEQGSIFNKESRCSFSQMKEGNVELQVLAVFSETAPHSFKSGLKQLEIFSHLLNSYSNHFHLGTQKNKESIGILPAIENLSVLIEENEPLEVLFERLDHLNKKHAPLYISLTWNSENRFGGGCLTQCGLKDDGKDVLHYLHEKGISVDLSHSSDRLAEDILNTIEQRNLKIIPIASHSNFRDIINHPRNLPNEFAQEIIRKEGLIGINFVQKFLGEPSPHAFIKQIDHALSLGGENHLCFGADFFFDKDSPNFNLNLNHVHPLFDESYGNSSCYPALIKDLQSHYSQQFIEKICHKNFHQFFNLWSSKCLSLAT